MSRRYKPLGLRREVLLFLPLAALLLAIVASFNLLVYRNAIEQIEGERRAEALDLATRGAALLSTGPAPSAERLEQLAPHASAVAVFDGDARVVAQAGTPIPLEPQTLLPPAAPLEPTTLGPLEIEAPTIAALAPFERRGRRYHVQIDLPARSLSAHRASLRRILILNAAVLGSLTLLILLFARRLLQPFESLLDRARRIDPGRAPDLDAGDEVDFLVRTFESALATLDRPPTDDAAQEIAVLERTLAPSLSSGFMLLDRGGRVLAVNPVGAELLGIESPAQPAGIAEMLRHLPAVRQKLVEAVDRQTTIQRYECEIEGDGGPRVIGLTVHPLRREETRLRGFIVLFADLTSAHADERRERLDQSLRQLGELAAGMAHELRNGLATLKGYLGLMEHGPDDASIADYLVEMRTESEHLERVLADFLAFARPGTARLERLDIVDVVGRAAADPALGDAAVHVEAATDLPPTDADPQLIERAIRNLLRNAVEAQARTAASDPVRVTVERTDDTVEVRIEDAGPGLDPAVRERLFQPFASGRADGVGLGLALAHRIARLHGGDLVVENGTGRGAVARLWIPVTNDT